jgi:hypothetical protein
LLLLRLSILVFTFFDLLLALLLPSLLKSQIKVQVKYLGVALFKMLAAADLRVLELVEDRDCIFAERLVQCFKELFWVFCTHR